MQVAKFPAEHSEFKSLAKPQLRALADELLAEDPATIDYCVKFVLDETKGL